ncbi:MAG: hypothetical protein P8Y48_17570 [Novosphingobium sp.]
MNDKDQQCASQMPAAIANGVESSLEGETIATGERRLWSAPRLRILPTENTMGPSTFASGQAAHVS